MVIVCRKYLYSRTLRESVAIHNVRCFSRKQMARRAAKRQFFLFLRGKRVSSRRIVPVLILPACKRGKYPPEKRQSREKCPLKREKINEPACKKKEMSAGEEKK